MLVTLKDVMKIAEERKMAVGSFNTPNLESLQAVTGAAQELGLPVIIQFAQCHEPWIPLSVIGPVMVEAAKRASVPVCVHLDHGETPEYLQQALDLGFTAVMYDGSVLPYEENLANTRKAVEMAARTGASVEAELGSMGRRESGTGDDCGEKSGSKPPDSQWCATTDQARDMQEYKDETKIYTDPELAARFVRETGIDALACSFGTTHGIYLTEPKLDFDVVKNVRRLAGGIPVVMHGGSGVGREDYRRAIQAGVRKVNYFTYMDKSGGSAAADYLKSCREGDPVFFSSLSMAAQEAMKENVKTAMRQFALLEE